MKMLKRIIAFTIVATFIVTAVYIVPVKADVFNLVTFYYGGKVNQQMVQYGADAIPPADTYVPGYVFWGWQGNYSQVTEARDIVGIYNADPHYKGIATAPINSGNNVTMPVTVIPPLVIQGQVQQTPDYTTTYEVNFVDTVTGQKYYHQTVSYMADANPIDPPYHDYYNFAGYDGDYTKVTSDRTIYANYDYYGNEKGHKKHWRRGDGYNDDLVVR